MNTKTNDRMIQPYLFFGGRCEEALEYYRRALGAKVEMLMRFKDCPEPSGCPDDWADKVMHASFRLGDTSIMASDGCWKERKCEFGGFALSLSVADEGEADRRFAALASEGTVQMPLGKTFYSARFGMVTDRFGVAWMVIVPAEKPVGAGKLEAVAG